MKRLSRRDFTLGSLAAGVFASLPTKGSAQSTASPALSEDLQKLIDAAKQGNAQATRMRMNTKLPEGSEPCTIFQPWEPKSK